MPRIAVEAPERGRETLYRHTRSNRPTHPQRPPGAPYGGLTRSRDNREVEVTRRWMPDGMLAVECQIRRCNTYWYLMENKQTQNWVNATFAAIMRDEDPHG